MAWRIACSMRLLLRCAEVVRTSSRKRRATACRSSHRLCAWCLSPCLIIGRVPASLKTCQVSRQSASWNIQGLPTCFSSSEGKVAEGKVAKRQQGTFDDTTLVHMQLDSSPAGITFFNAPITLLCITLSRQPLKASVPSNYISRRGLLHNWHK